MICYKSEASISARALGPGGAFAFLRPAFILLSLFQILSRKAEQNPWLIRLI